MSSGTVPRAGGRDLGDRFLRAGGSSWVGGRISGTVPLELADSTRHDDSEANDGFGPKVCFLTNEQAS